MKIVSIAFVVLIAVLFFLSQKPQQNPRAMHPTNLCVAGASCEKPSECGILANHPGPDTLLGECRAGMCVCNGSGGGGGGATTIDFTCPNGDVVPVTCSSGSSGGGGGTGSGGQCEYATRPPEGCMSLGSDWKNNDCPNFQPNCYKGLDSSCHTYCKCLSFNTRISTPSGEVTVQDVKVGDLVYSQDSSGNRVIVPVKRVSKVNVENHHVVHLVLKDGRESWVSASHPLTFIYSSSAVEKPHSTGALFMGDLKAGDAYDGSVVVSADLIPYQYDHTYDLLPDSDTGYYFANGILMGSTLK